MTRYHFTNLPILAYRSTAFVVLDLEEARSLVNVMTEAIAGLIGDVLGTPLDAFRWSLIRFFVGGKVARMLGVPSHPVRDRLTHSVTGLALLLDTVVDRPGPLRRWFRTSCWVSDVLCIPVP